ncbi:protein-L-isoaspartate(D-aspartate) O-methyltransferase [Sulfurovum sp.]|jgi:protein-L-isoaspartate(D-aspartate) O-methyltransferase|uniref:protein-L-isoaspartate(D-aspartate) O-methyltransferase n=1 Tax=Sulfurovum sp. TaxID=1969726 RepID=UPI002A360A3E|nr:protein-L-isoaspartate(D-aspartate) O-methyltransferase [Sulfurovum sp.]MDD2450637.1 protein-L-isoaspartate(D-aspartate) O-methyltransferase [Sulfurovum sp.]MDD3499159.1 protein-L-isoaspartate(D-aspartate) O-methyltransferase [Sulfurovum sp.]MDY0402800.1 protein-L-isoaspartate(D-aspartate) O-methyltransferase [Sulfurovum sp.]
MTKERNLHKLVDEIDKKFPLEPHVREALLSIDREAFVPAGFKPLAYTLDALPMAASQWISSPLTVAKMTQHLELKGVDSVLEIGCGSGYQAAVLSRICRRVFTIERIDELLKEAKKRFSELELHNIFTRFDDGQRGWKQYAPFERILFSATAKEIPEVLFEQLAEGGILLAPVEEAENYHIITRYYKKNGRITSEAIEQSLFVPILDGTQK